MEEILILISHCLESSPDCDNWDEDVHLAFMCVVSFPRGKEKSLTWSQNSIALMCTGILPLSRSTP